MSRIKGMMQAGVALASLIQASLGLAQQSQTTTVQGVEQIANGVSDSGRLMVTADGYSKSVAFGMYSTAASLASGLAAAFSQDCQSPVSALARGTTLTFRAKSSSTSTFTVTGSSQWNNTVFAQSSFHLPTTPSSGPPVTSSTPLSLSCTPMVVPADSSLECSGQVSSNATGTITFSLDGQSAWATVSVNAGWASTAPLGNISVGAHTITATYSGDGSHVSSTQTVAIQALAGSLPTQQIYAYSLLQPDGSTSGYGPNGDVTAFTDTVNGQWTAGYDALDRLTSATQTVTSGSLSGLTSQNLCWTYDSFGNRTLQARSPNALTSCDSSAASGKNIVSATYDSTNHLTAVVGEAVVQGGSGTYSVVSDASGNTQQDAANTYWYDGEGRVCAVQHTVYGPIVGYLHDTEGIRVAKGTLTPPSNTDPCDMTTNGFTVTNEYVAGPGGEQLTEFDGNGQWQHTNVC